CHAFVLTGTDEDNRERADQFRCLLEENFPGKPVFSSEYYASGLVMQEKKGERIPVSIEQLAGRRCFAFCGIARPEGFKQTLSKLAIEPVGFRALADHHSYTRKVVRQLTVEAEKADANFFICTEKDLAKLCDCDLRLPLYGVVMEVLPDSGLTSLILKGK
ncbi:MAG: tetraacyldisaccharide 4'-kinase, partial [Candidatus Electrothrix sp. AR4]|nr:tetraacyldisaccharide 4'-kinase [Candidatus Electrothrix sp. AR4]